MGKILIYALSENFGGVEEYTLNLSRYSSDNRYGYILLGKSSPYEKEMKERDLEYYKIPSKKHLFKNIKTTYLLLKKLRKKYDVLYINTSALGYILPYLIAYKLGYRLVLHSHLDARETSSKLKILIHKFNYRLLKNKISQKLTCSFPAAEWMFGKDANKAIVIPNAVNLDKFTFDIKERKYYKKKLHLNDSFVIGNIGRLTYFKNQKFLIDILKKINDPKIKLLLIGDGEDKDKLKKYVDDLNLSSRVIFYGKSHSPEKLMNVIDCIVMPSIAEGFPVTLVEAQAAGLPCVVSNVITKEVNITKNVYFLSLNSSVDLWKKVILNEIRKPRYDAKKILRDNGFEVKDLEKSVYQYIEK